MVDVQAFPHEERLHGPRVQRLQRIIYTVHVLARILRNFFKVLADQALLLDELDVLQDVSGELDCLEDEQRESEKLLGARRHIEVMVEDDVDLAQLQKVV